MRERMCMLEGERERECVCVCLCVKKERDCVKKEGVCERGNVYVRGRERECVCV